MRPGEARGETLSSDAAPETIEAYLRLLATSDLSGPRAPRHVGLAVSGGADSVAMLWLVAPWAKEQGIPVSVATVDHGLRRGSAEEARFVGEVCRFIGVPHDTLAWTDWDGRGNLQAKAREARRGLLAAWARSRGAEAVLLAHTEDDQAETLLLRLARGSGVDGLSGMSRDRTEGGMRWMRPFLSQSRASLRAYLHSFGRAWIEDPSNADERFDRVKARRVLEALEPLGIEPSDLARTAWRQSLASRALSQVAVDAARRIAMVTAGGDVAFESDAFAQLPWETQLRLAAGAIQWVSGSPYRPRLTALQSSLAESLRHPRTLCGALLRRRREPSGLSRLVIGREPRAAARAVPVPTTAIWDSRWLVTGPHAPELEVRLLGEVGVALCPDWRASGLERSSVLASPAIWQGETLVAAPLAGREAGWTAEVATDFVATLGSGY